MKKLTTETGAGQWGSALAFATCLLDMECEVCVRACLGGGWQGLGCGVKHRVHFVDEGSGFRLCG